MARLCSGGADMAGLLEVVIMLLILQCQSRDGCGCGGAEAAEDSRLWPNYKPFRAGDVLREFLETVFKYKAGQHNVVAVRDLVAYSLCRQFPVNSTTYSSGDDRVTLARGMTFFLCNVSDHCTNGMKMAVTAS